MSILSRFKNIATIVLDMDGVLTDGNLTVASDGRWIRRMSVKDGYALQLAVKQGLAIIVISGSDSPPVEQRLHALGIKHVFMGIKQKAAFLKDFANAHGLDTQTMLFMGDDIPDYECMKMVGLACCPADAVLEIRSISSYVSPLAGGRGCVRDVIEKVLKLNNQWPFDTAVTST